MTTERPTRPRTDPARTSPTAADVVVIASTSGPGELVGLLDAVLAGDLVPGHLVIITGTGADDFGPTLAAHPLPKQLESVRVARLKGEISPQRALTEALEHIPADQTIRYAWLLTHSSRPAPRTLAMLHETGQTARSPAVVAPKVRTRESPHRVLSVGYPITAAGRWVPRPAVGETDQGQYDDRSDVLATSGVGALVDVEALRTVGGYAPRLTRASDAVAADVDLGWRLHRRQHRVLLDPRGVVDVDADEAAELGLGPLPSSARHQLRSIALGAAPLVAWLPRILGVLATAVIAAVLLLLAKRPLAAWRELVDGLSVLRLGRASSAHRRFSGRGQASVGGLGQLFISREVARDALVDDVIPHRRQRPETTRTDHQLRGQRPQAVAHPAFLAVLAAILLVLAQGRELGGSLFGRLGWGVTGGEVTGSTATAASLWRSASDAWGGSGLGAETIWSPALGLLAGATTVVEHLPFVDPPAAPAAATVAAILFLTLPLATLTMYAALATVTPRRSIRAFGGIAWAATGLASDTIAEGRLGGAVVLVTLPLAAAALVRALGPRGRSYDAAQAGLALALIGAFAPAVAALGVILVVLLGLAPRWSFRRALGAAVVPALVLAPFLRALVAEPQAGLGGVGLFNWAGEIPPPWRLALLDVSAPAAIGLPDWLTPAMPFLAVPLLLLALLGVVRSRRGLASLTAVLIAGLALAAAIVASRLVVDTVPVGVAGAGEPIRPWAGALLSVYALVVVALATRGLDLLARVGLRRRGTRPLATLAGATTVGVLLLGTGWVGFGSTLSTFVDPRPAVAVDHADGPLAGRTLVIDRLTAAEGVADATAYRIVGAESGLPVRTLPGPTEVSQAVGEVVSRLDVGGVDDSAESDDAVAAVLARHAVGFIALSSALPAEVERALDATAGLRRLPDRPGQRWWRVDSTTSEVPSPARVVLRADGGDGVAVPSRHHGQTATRLEAGGTLEVAQTPRWARDATVRVGGQVLQPDLSAATVSYTVPEPGPLSIDLAAPDRGWRLLAAIAFLIVGYAALPFGGSARPSQESR